jgi:hypothetical protein
MGACAHEFIDWVSHFSICRKCGWDTSGAYQFDPTFLDDCLANGEREKAALESMEN